MGPFKILKKHGKYCELDIRGKIDKVSVDRLKPAYLDEEEKAIFVKNSTKQKDPAIICYGPSIKCQEQMRSERSDTLPTQPLEESESEQRSEKKKRGRPTREMLAARERAAEAHARDQDQREREDKQSKTRFGRISRPPDRL